MKKLIKILKFIKDLIYILIGVVFMVLAFVFVVNLFDNKK